MNTAMIWPDLLTHRNSGNIKEPDKNQRLTTRANILKSKKTYCNFLKRYIDMIDVNRFSFTPKLEQKCYRPCKKKPKKKPAT